MPKAPKQSKTKNETKNFTKVFETFGVSFSMNGSAEALADACPWCNKHRFYVNSETGLYHCKHCNVSGNVTTYLTWLHEQFLAETTNDQYRKLKEKRGIGMQTLKRHGLAFDAVGQQWLIPFRNSNGNVVNLQRYNPTSGSKLNMPGLATSIYGLNTLSKDKKKILFLCEGPFDAMALDYHLALKRSKYDILATPGTFQEKWAEHFAGRKVRALYDNDAGGEAHRKRVRKLLGESRVAAELRLLKWPDGFPDGCDVNDLVRDHSDISIVGWSLDNSIKVAAETKLDLRHGWERKATEEETAIEWIWPDHIRTGTYVSFSGQQGTMKSTIMGELVALYTRGKPMPLCKRVGMPAGHVLYIHAEDDDKAMWKRLELAGADINRITLHAATLKDGNCMNMLEHLGEMEQTVREFGTRLIVIDGQNSVVGTPDISTDMKGRFNVTNRLHQFAQRLDVCLIGIRNEDTTGRAMGSQSMGDISRCVLRAELVKDVKGERYYRLVFVKISDSAPSTHPPIPYGVKNLGENRRKIVWGKSYHNEVKASLKEKPR